MGTGQLNNITIISNNITIRCNNVGAISCTSCSNIIMEGIVFDRCGQYPTLSGGVVSSVYFYFVFNISIKICTFQNSKTFPVILYHANENIMIQ